MTNPKLFQNTNKRYQLRNSELQACNVKEKEAVLQRFFSNFRNCGCTLQSCNFITRELHYIFIFFRSFPCSYFIIPSWRYLWRSLAEFWALVYTVFMYYMLCTLLFPKKFDQWVSEWVPYLKSDSTRDNLLIFLEVRLSLHEVRLSLYMKSFRIRNFCGMRRNTPYPSVFTPNVGK